MIARALAVLAVLLLLAGCSGSPEVPKRPQAEPDRLPEVALKAFEGSGELDLGTLKGPVVVNLWASWCGPCKRELPVYQQFAREHGAQVKVIGIDFQETRLATAQQLIRTTGVTYPLYADPDGALRAIGLPKILLVDADGTVTFEKYEEMTSADQIADLVREHLPGAIS